MSDEYVEQIRKRIMEEEPVRIDFFLPGEPPTVTAQEKGLTTRKVATRFGVKYVPMAYETPEVKNQRAEFAWKMSPYKPEKPLKGPIRLITVWTWAPKGRHKAGTYRDTKPDTDNIIKLLKDAMGDLRFFENDSRVADERTIKRWGSRPGIRIIIEEIGGHDDGQPLSAESDLR